MPSLETYTGGIAATNAHLFTLPGGLLLIDAPEGAAAWLKKCGVKIDALLLTHQHFDHVLDAAAIKAQHGCPIYSWSAFSRNLTLETLFGAVTGSSMSVPEFTVDHLLEDTTSLQVAGAEWQLYHIPGHSPDSVCFHLTDANIIFGGDVLFRDSIGRTDFPGGSFDQLVSGIRTHLWPLPPETQVFPGHGPGTTIGWEKQQNPFIGAAADTEE